MNVSFVITNIQRISDGGGGYNVRLTLTDTATGNVLQVTIPATSPIVAQATIGRAVNAALTFP